MRADTHEDIFGGYHKDPKYRKAARTSRPRYDLVVQIIKLRNKLGLTQKQLAKKAKTYQSRISKIESAEHDMRLSTLIQIAEALDSEVVIQLVPFTEPVEDSKTIVYKQLFKDNEAIPQKPSDKFSPSEKDGVMIYRGETYG